VDCFQLAIGDKIVRPPRDFVQSFVEICYAVYAPGITSPSGLYNALAKPYVEQYELEVKGGRMVPLLVEDEEEGWPLLWKR